jgi:dihydroorotase
VRICHVSSRGSLEHANPYTTWEVTPHHLLVREEDLGEWRGVAKTNPPLRSRRDVKALWEGIRTGKITIIASDHAPHRARDKDKAMEDAPPGIPNLDVMLRLLLTEVSRRRITLPELVGMMCENPARLLGLGSKGRLSPGMDADIVVLYMAEKGRVSVDEFFSKARYSPFEGRKLVGGVDKVFLRGKLVYEDGEITAKKGYGKPLVKATP